MQADKARTSKKAVALTVVAMIALLIIVGWLATHAIFTVMEAAPIQGFAMPVFSNMAPEVALEFAESGRMLIRAWDLPEVIGGEKAFLLQKPYSQEEIAAILEHISG